MNKPLIAGLLTAWCVTLVAPAWIVYFAFRGIDQDTPIIGPIIAIWIVGYLIQFGIFMAVARKSSGNSILGWLLASTMPFVADWTVPVAPWSPAAVLVVVGAYAVWFHSRLARSDDLQHNGIPATGTVLDVKKPIMNMIINSVYIRRTMTLRIERADGTPPYEAKYSGTFMLGEIPGPGAVFSLRVDPKNPMHFETVDDASAPTPSPPASQWIPQNDPTIAEQLQQLDEMHHRGALTDAEFAAAKDRVLRG
ncbi:SHOCT domain-containing protein [Mycolicibacterium sp.]|uniref:SHOCT domain-containing protein n=1 Tax=Mycolicibacterium sp. TaxID=2320850 RepID=UPI001A22E50B|nr:SHOCT domain-containing protein [Mycolicibacterium sp.]MBJ7341023.1 SHOCT domain-containing protein [Mycolicibacterium sp.]